MSPRTAIATGWAGLALLILALNLTPISNNDIFLHLTTGRLVIETGLVPRLDDYSATAAGRPYIAHEWLAAVIFRIVERSGGLDALIVFKILVMLATGALLYLAGRRLGASPGIALACLGPVMVLAAARCLERPHILSWLLTALFLLLLARRRAGAAASASVFVGLQILWANLHGGFVLGPALVGLAAGGAFLDAHLEKRADSRREGARLAGIAGVLVAACLVNPYGAQLLRFPFALAGSRFMTRIYEWQPTIDSRFAGTYMARWYWAWVICGTVAFAGAIAARRWHGRALPGGSFPVLLFAALFVLSLQMNRNVTDFALATVPGVAMAIASIGRSGWRGRPASADAARPGLLIALGGGFVLAAGWFASHGYAYSPSLRRPFGVGVADNIPVAAADFLEHHGVRGNLFNSYAAGAYLVYRLYPGVRVAMDSRNDVYGETLYAEYRRALEEPDALEALLTRIDARAIVLEWTREGAAQTAAAVHAIDHWVVVHFDDTAIVYLRTDGPLAALAARDGFAHLDPARWRPGHIAAGETAAMLEETARAVDRSPSFVARVMRADALIASGQRREALDLDADLFAEDPPLPHLHACLGLIRLMAGDREGAAARFRRALELRPDFGLAVEGLREATGGEGR